MDGDIEMQIKAFKQDFRDILMETYAWLKSRFPDVEKAVSWLNESTISRTGAALAIKGDKDYVAFCQELQKQWRYTRPDILALFIEEEGTDDLKRKMRKYTTNYQEFCFNFKLEKTRSLTILLTLNRALPSFSNQARAFITSTYFWKMYLVY